MKKWITVLLASAMVFSLSACGGSGDGKSSGDSDGSDMDYVKEKGTLVVGITDFEPMDYKGDDDEWIGFDADMARAWVSRLNS